MESKRGAACTVCLPEVIQAVAAGEVIFKVAGEKDADNMRLKVGVVATTNPLGEGKGKWKPPFTETLTGGRIVVIADKDATGRQHADEVAAALHGKVKSLKVLELPDRDGHQVKDASDWLAAGGTREELEALASEAPEWKPPHPEGLESILGEVEKFISRYVITGVAELIALVLWVVHTYVFAAAECTPYIHITSPEKQSGKTRLLEALALLVARAWFTCRVSAAVLVRKVARDMPTLLLDETDSAFNADSDYSETLRAILNAGYRRGGVASLCVKKGGDFELVDFPVFCPKALAGIGELPDTIEDRSIRINLKRRSPSEPVERFRLRQA